MTISTFYKWYRIPSNTFRGEMGSCASKPSDEQLEGIHVVIIGAGYAGLELAAALTKSGLPFTLIEPKEYMHHCVAALRWGQSAHEAKHNFMHHF